MNNILLVSATELEHGESHLYDHEIHIIGIGKANAAARTAYLINEYNPDVVVNFGSCGGIHGREKLNVGEVYKVGKVINDLDVMELCKDPDILLQGKGDINCFTTDRFFVKSDLGTYSRTLSTRFNEIDIIDMELYGIAKTCQVFQKRLYSYKWIADDGNIDQWKENAKIGYEEFKQIFKDTFL